jgi:hypothetical protein
MTILSPVRPALRHDGYFAPDLSRMRLRFLVVALYER